MKTVDEEMRIITKGVNMLVNEEELRQKLIRSRQEGKGLVVKLGLDPSAPDIHLGHAVVLRKIRQLQDLGHTAVIVIGDFTGRIGDPSGKSKGRNALSKEQVEENARTYFEQIFRVLDQEKTVVRYNSEWLARLNFEEILRLASVTTVARMLERDDFQNRYRSNVPIGLHEFFYPLMQAYDSVELKADIEMGGSDQTFNILMGRTLQKAMGMEPQIAMFMPLLEGLDGVEKMSKSLGNYIGVSEPAKVIFKKVMEIPDSLIVRYFELATDEHPDTVEEIKRELEAGKNPRDVKYRLASIITGLYSSDEETQQAMDYYDRAFSQKKIPDQIPELLIDPEKDRLSDILPLLTEHGFTASNSEFKRVLKQGGVSINQEKAEDLDVVMANGDVLKIGKKVFVRIVK